MDMRSKNREVKASEKSKGIEERSNGEVKGGKILTGSSFPESQRVLASYLLHSELETLCYVVI